MLDILELIFILKICKSDRDSFFNLTVTKKVLLFLCLCHKVAAFMIFISVDCDHFYKSLGYAMSCTVVFFFQLL